MIKGDIFRKRWPLVSKEAWFLFKEEAMFAHVRDFMGRKGYYVKTTVDGSDASEDTIAVLYLKNVLMYSVKGDAGVVSKLCVAKALNHYESVLRKGER